MPAEPRVTRPPSGSIPRVTGYWLLLLAAAVSIWQLKLAPFLFVGTFLARLAVPRGADRFLRGLSLASIGLALIGFVRFLVIEAVPGIVEAGTRATQDAAVSKLREILGAQDALRRTARWDPDGDGIGSAARLEELTGRAPLRGSGRRFSPPLLERYPTVTETKLGPAVEMAGYLFVVCLPQPGGGFGAQLTDPVDEELAERRFLAYAWPARPGRGLHETFFIDEHEQIKRTSNPRFVGPDSPPSCDAALSSAGPAWRDWKGKRPRRTLPGDK